MYKLFKYICIAGILFTFTSCEKFLDVQPKGDLIPKTVQDFDLLAAAPDFFNTALMPMSLDEDYYHPTYISLPKDHLSAYLWKDYFYDQTEDDLDWNSAYRSIFNANTILDNIDDASGAVVEKNRVRAEALFHRAYNFFTLVNLYAKHYNAATAATDPGIPLILSAALKDKSDYQRNSVKEVYERVIADLTAAVTSLPAKQDNNARPTIAAAYGFLARVYLYMGDFAKAKEMATASLNENNKLFDLRINTSYGSNLQLVSEILVQKIAAIPRFMNTRAATKALVFEPKDLRLTRLFSSFGSFNYKLFVTYLFGPSVAEMYLIRAEVNARNNDMQGALDDLNTLRQFRFLAADYQPIQASAVPDIFELVMLERRRELMFKGHRFFDTKRLNAEGKWNRSLERIDATNTVIATLSAKDNKWVLAIPRKVITQFNNSLTQNPR